MPVNEAEELLALALIVVVHVAGAIALVWGMFDRDSRPDWWPRPWGRRGDPDDPKDDPRPSPPSGRLPLPGAAPSRARLRDEVPLRDRYPRPARRPQREPEPVPERTPQRR